MARFCSECGIPLPEKVLFCPSCNASTLDRLLASQTIIPSVESSSAAEEGVFATESSHGEGEGAERALEESVGPLGEGRISAPSEETPSGEGGAGVESAGSVIEAETVPTLTLADAMAALRFLLDHRRILWYGTSTMIGWMLLVVFQLLGSVAVESPKLAATWRIVGWGAFIAMFALSSATLAASLIIEGGPRLRLTWAPASGILQRLPAIVGPATLFAGIIGFGIVLLLALGALARMGTSGRLLWALLFIPQFLLALGIVSAGLALLAALIYGPTLAVTNGGTFSQTLYRLYLLFAREGKRAMGYLLLLLALGGLLGALIQIGIGLVVQGIEHLALWASRGETAAIVRVGREVIAACMPGHVGLEEDRPFVPLRVESDLRLAGFLWAISVIVLRGVGVVIPLLLVSGGGALAAWGLLGRLARSPHRGEEARV
ncbi:MAG: zinc ribbon domain-containing protein [Blastocatellia bacterium]|nr:zinc ribbon domain-containing protein [Blastocatellia bacterium]MCS7157378.1 zinc ribbon domain-containing protein [Blastocatellia bacterium]MCX7753244.1 zinc ribbon domain-containing protein [Blastocatellia bacterium]MDW8168283.1 zinc ribbon domain-containing protein [Acidobacteriota bacterium]MDW8255424.1 zinc ribbon domain-containing protein [Acidobacteriota bacterium]